jgi:hypothetical protein
VNPAASLQPGMIEEVLFRGDALAMDALGDLDVAVQRIGHQVDGIVLAREITHGSRTF